MTTIPDFPHLRPLGLEDKGLLDGLFKKYPPLVSEFTFTNLFAWRHAYCFGLSRSEGCVLVAGEKGDARIVFDPIGPPARKKGAIEKCFRLQGEERPLKFSRLPEDTAVLFQRTKSYIVQEDRDNFDYVYATQDLIELKGKNFDGKRNFIKRFKVSYPFRCRPLTKADIRECLFFKEEWCLAKDCQHIEGLSREREALNEMLENFEYLGIEGLMIEVKGKIEAVTLGERLNPETFVIHMEKANGALVGIYQTINQEFCRANASAYAYVNREQDLGVPGLRQAKESYHPVRMIKKFGLIPVF